MLDSALKMLKFWMYVQTGNKPLTKNWNMLGGGSGTGFGWKSSFFSTAALQIWAQNSVDKRTIFYCCWAASVPHSKPANKVWVGGFVKVLLEGIEADKITVIFSSGVLSAARGIREDSFWYLLDENNPNVISENCLLINVSAEEGIEKREVGNCGKCQVEASLGQGSPPFSAS